MYRIVDVDVRDAYFPNKDQLIGATGTVYQNIVIDQGNGWIGCQFHFKPPINLDYRNCGQGILKNVGRCVFAYIKLEEVKRGKRNSKIQAP